MSAAWDLQLTRELRVLPQYGLSVIGRLYRRSCGCFCSTGIRLDRDEAIFGATPCPLHDDETEAVLAALKSMPPSDEPIEKLFERLLEAAIAGTTREER